ncbi:hypothetical protein CMEL01_11085 [Colletotrichum melonis]|uniref:Uncharacterized protein n=1 Tax=Colletotrichum melonis TaxID=1209925 RepID=A0AAI9UYB2_9PEZI|nr:hypothetical protein CMEL01_11085 [Colletotrichum melonis]
MSYPVGGTCITNSFFTLWSAQRILICTASALQDVIERVVNKRHHAQCDKLRIVVSSAIESIFYQIDSFIKNVYIKVCGTIRSNTRYKLRIDEKSTYCSHPSDSWLYSELSAAGTHELTHFNGIYFPHRERDYNQETEALDWDREGMWPEFKAEDKEEILKKLRKVKIAYEQTSSSVAPDAQPNSPADTRRAGNGPGFFKALLSAVVGIVSALGAAGGVVWLNTSGVLINGPLGFRLAAGYASAGVAGGACAAGMGVGAGAGAAIYLIPWDLLWRIIKPLFARFWGCVCDFFAWLWEKIKALPSWFGSWF